MKFRRELNSEVVVQLKENVMRQIVGEILVVRRMKAYKIHIVQEQKQPDLPKQHSSLYGLLESSMMRPIFVLMGT